MSPAAAVLLAPLAIAIFVDHFGVSDVILVFILVLAGPCGVLYGLTLTAAEHAEKPNPGEAGYLGLWIAHHLPLPLARAFWVMFGSAWCVLLGYILWLHAS